MTTNVINCRFCGQDHGLRCPSVKAVEYFENGHVKRVEFVTPADYLPFGVVRTPYDPNKIWPVPTWGPATCTAN